MKAVIFDFDGVVVDSEKYWIDLDEHFFPTVASGYTLDHGKEMMGLGRRAGYDYLVEKLNMSLSYEDYCAALEEHVRDIYFTKTQLLPGVRELLAEIVAVNMPLAIASSSRHKWISGALSRFGLAEVFHAISTADDVGDRTKPFPDVYLHAAAALGVDPADCLAIEDSRNGIKAAKAAGMYCIGLQTDMSKEQDLSQADRLIMGFQGVTLSALLGK
jgi:HAD superfamily hydrolase (TIGR01509 family)